MGFFPLDMDNIMKGWCGDNAFGFRTSPGGFNGNTEDSYLTANSHFGDTFYGDSHFSSDMNHNNLPQFLILTDYPDQQLINAAAFCEGNLNFYVTGDSMI